MRLVFLSVVLMLLASCGGDEKSGAPTELADTLAEGEVFLKETVGKQGVVATESGLMYEVLEAGSGKSPKPTDKVVVHYTGWLLDGTEFDSSRGGEPATFPANRLIKGWVEALQLMKEGDRWVIYVPPELGYGERGTGPIPGNSVLKFEIELIEVIEGNS